MKSLRHPTLALLLLLLTAATLSAQQYLPIVRTHEYDNKMQEGEYGGAITYDRYNRIFIALPNGLQIFDGNNKWFIKVENITALEYDASTDRIYVGCKNDMGYLVMDNGHPSSTRFHSLNKDLNKTEQESGHIRKIFFLKTKSVLNENLKPGEKASQSKMADSRKTAEVCFYSDQGLYLFKVGKADELSSIPVPKDPKKRHSITLRDVGKRFSGATKIGHKICLFTPHKGTLEYAGEGDRRYVDAANPNSAFWKRRITFSMQLSKFTSLLGVQLGERTRLYTYSGRNGAAELGIDIPATVFAAEKVSPTQVFLATKKKGCYIIDPENGRQAGVFNTFSGLEENEIRGIVLDPNKRLWLTHPRNYSHAYVGMPLSDYNERSGTIYDLERYNGKIYIATSDGVYNPSDEAVRPQLVTDRDSEINRSILDGIEGELEKQDLEIVVEDDDLKESGSLSKGNKKNKTTRSTTDALKDYDFKKVVLRNDFRSYSRIKTIPQARCIDLEPWRGQLLVATNDGLYAIVGRKAEAQSFKRALTKLSVSLKAPRSMVFAANRKKLFVLRYTDGQWKSLNEDLNLVHEINSMEEDERGRLWVGTSNGLFLYDFNTSSGFRTTASPIPFLGGHKVQIRRVFNSSRESELLALSNGQVYSIDETQASKQKLKPRKDTRFNALRKTELNRASDKIKTIAGNGQFLWVLTGEVAHFCELSRDKLNIVGSSNFLRLLQGSGVTTTTADNKDLWLSANRHVYNYSPSSLVMPVEVDGFRTHLLRTNIEGKPFFSKFFEIDELPKSFTDVKRELPYGTNYSLELELSSPMFEPGTRKYEYRIIDVRNLDDPIPTEAEEINWKEFRGDRLPIPTLTPGAKIIQVRAVNVFGNRSQPAELRIIVQKPFWQEWWFFVILALLIAAASIYFQRLRDRRIKMRNLELEEAVAEKTHELQSKNDMLERQKQTLQENVRVINEQQEKLVDGEKMAALGRIAANTAHELNTPLGAIKNAAESTSEILPETLNALPGLFNKLSATEAAMLLQLLERSMRERGYLTTREERTYRLEIEDELVAQDIPSPEWTAELLVKAGLFKNISNYYDLFRSKHTTEIMDVIDKMSGVGNHIRNINSSTGKMQKVISSLKNYAYKGQKDAMEVVGSVTESIENILDLYQSSLRQGIEVVKNYEDVPDIPLYESEISQVWTNVIMNAVQAMKGKGTITLSVLNRGDYIRVIINNDGPEIPETHLEKIFQPLFTTKPKGIGTGLGLDICRKIVEKHEGTIHVESAPGDVSFIIDLPKSGAVSQPASSTATNPAPNA